MTSAPPTSPPLVAFGQALQVGVPAIDGQHRSLVETLNRLIADAQAMPGSERFSDVLSQLGVDLSEHFEFEESTMLSLGMPPDQLHEHVAAHGEILQQYVDLNLKLMHRQADSRGAVLAQLRGWVLKHIVEHDLLIREYVVRP